MAEGRGLADTSVFVAVEAGRCLDVGALPSELAVSVITVGELRAGVLAAPDVDTRDRRLGTLEAALALTPVPVDERVAAAWTRLKVQARDAGCRIRANDSWIAATAIALGVPLVTQDADYLGVPGLEVIVV